MWVGNNGHLCRENFWFLGLKQKVQKSENECSVPKKPRWHPNFLYLNAYYVHCLIQAKKQASIMNRTQMAKVVEV